MSTLDVSTLVLPGAPGAPQATSNATARTAVLMDTFVTIQLADGARAVGADAAIARAFDWFRRVEAACSRFDSASEVMRLLATVGQPTPVSDILYQAVTFALAVADASHGAFDPTIGHLLEQRGFDRNYRTGATVATPIASKLRPTYRDVRLDPARRAITLLRPLILDLGAVAKGLAIDLAARELAPFGSYAINAGGDLRVQGLNPAGQPWQIGLKHPRQPGAILGVVQLAEGAVCTSGDYERPSPEAGTGHHLLDPRTGRSVAASASITVIAPTALAADALGTAAFVLGPRRGLRLLERQGAEGLIVTTTLEQHQTAEFGRYLR
ncbi:MAG: FAD:protein FMN transferase [Thermomicrobiales bacterium]